MKRVILALLVLLFILPGVAVAGGPAPNSGDGLSDGSGMDTQVGPAETGQAEDSAGPAGPAPNSGDGVNDGSGMD